MHEDSDDEPTARASNSHGMDVDEGRSSPRTRPSRVNLDDLVAGLRVKGNFEQHGAAEGTIMGLKVEEGEGVANIKLDSGASLSMFWKNVPGFLASTYPSDIAEMKFATGNSAIESVIKATETPARPPRSRPRNSRE